MKNTFFLIAFLLLGFKHLEAQKHGCTDILANNYDSSAKINDGSCTYPSTSYSTKVVCSKLSDSLVETSGLIYYNNWFWTLNDSGNEPAIYAFDSLKGTIIHRTFIKNKTNIDWEEMTQDSNYIYIGEFGNNDGSRKDLKVYRIQKAQLTFSQNSDSINADEIQFNLADQTSFVSANQNHNYDMEAMCIWRDSLHLFSKNWVDGKTRHYVMPSVPGNYSLVPRETMNIGGLVTSACSNSKGDKIILGGYNTSIGACFIWLLYDFQAGYFFSGNKRKIDLGNALTFGQFEASAFRGQQLYLSNEKNFTAASLRRVEVNKWFSSIKKITPLGQQIILVYQSKNELTVESKGAIGEIKIYNSIGVCLLTTMIQHPKTTIDIHTLSSGVYTINVNGIAQKVLIEKW